MPPRRWQRDLVALAAAATLGCTQAGEEELRQEPDRPNVVLVVLDTTRADTLSAYGYPKPTSPSLESLAQQGARFDQAMTTDFWTLPAHASLLTGEYPRIHQATSETNRLPRRVTTLAEYLLRAGYRTRAYVSNAWIGGDRGFSQGFEAYIETWKANPGAPDDYRFDLAGVEGASAWANEMADAGENFFLFLNLNSAHMPYSPEVISLVDLSPEPRPIQRTRMLRKVKGMWAYLGGSYALTKEDFEILEDLYTAEILMVDRLVGQLADSLDRRGILDDTVFIVTADHGENLGDHGMVDHLLSMYETTIRVPLIIRYPPSFPAKSQRQELVSLIDIVPTVLHLCGLGDRYPALAARSLARPDRASHEFVIAENDRPMNGIGLMEKNFPDFDLRRIDRRMRMLRTEQHKLIWHDDGEIELYDLIADPAELNDLSSLDPELGSRLLGMLETWEQAQAAIDAPPALDVTDPKLREQLRALGYLE